MQIIDFIIIGMILLFALIGFMKGAIKTVLAMIGWIASAVASYLITPLLADILVDVESIRTYIIGETSIYSFVSAIIPDMVLDSGIVGTIFSPFMTIINAMDISPLTSTQAQGLVLSYAIFTGVVFMVTLLAIRITVKVIGMVARVGEAKGGISFGSRLFGFIVGGAQGLLYVAIIALGIL